MTDNGKTTGHEPLDAVVADALLDKLCSDDGFRAVFHRDPAKAMTLLGHDVSMAAEGAAKESIFACMQTTRLASKEEFQKARALLQQHLVSRANHTVVFAFEADRIASTLRKSDGES